MVLNLEQKQKIVAEVNQEAIASVFAVVAEYSGLRVSEMNALRKKAREENVYLRVVRNTLTKRALDKTEFACLTESLDGPVLIAFGKEEPKAAAALVRDFAKEHEKLAVKSLAMSGELFPKEALSKFADLPSRQEALTQLVSVMKAPIARFVKTLSAPYAKLVRTVSAIGETLS